MGNSPAFQYYPADLIADPEVMLWDADNIGCYWLLINYLWISGGKTEENLENFKKIFRKKSKKTAKVAWDKIKKKFIISDGVVAHKRIEKEMQRQIDTRLMRQKAANAMHAKYPAHAHAPAPPKNLHVHPSSSSSSSSSSEDRGETPRLPCLKTSRKTAEEIQAMKIAERSFGKYCTYCGKSPNEGKLIWREKLPFCAVYHHEKWKSENGQGCQKEKMG